MKLHLDTVLIILRFSIVILIIALALFFITDVTSPSFIALSLTIVFCTLVYAFGIFRLARDEERPLTKRHSVIALSVYGGVLLISIIVKVMIAVL